MTSEGAASRIAYSVCATYGNGGERDPDAAVGRVRGGAQTASNLNGLMDLEQDDFWKECYGRKSSPAGAGFHCRGWIYQMLTGG